MLEATSSESLDIKPLLYVDTHSMAPLNEPHDNSFNLLARLRDSDRAVATGGSAIYSEVFRKGWLPGRANWYPTTSCTLHGSHNEVGALSTHCSLNATTRGLSPAATFVEVAVRIFWGVPEG